MIRDRRLMMTLLSVVLATSTLAACGTGNSEGATTSPAPLPPAPTSTPGPVELGVADVTFAPVKDELATVPGGAATILTADGWTVYRFEEDEDKPPRVTCLNDCLEVWPPVLVDGAKITSLAGVDPTLVGTVSRPDGHSQVTYNGWPLYRFVDDKAKGELKGEGLGFNWSTVKPDGKPVFKKR